MDAKHYPTEKGTGYYAPGSNFAHGKTEISATESVTIGVSVQNKTQATYLLGVLLPIVPVFWWPENQFALRKENVQISCGATYSSGNKTHLDKLNDGSYRMNQKGVDAINRREKVGYDRCVGAVLILPDGKTLSPQKTDSQKGYTVFSFDVLAPDVKEFKFRITSLHLATGETVKTNFEYEARLLDWTRYVLFSPL